VNVPHLPSPASSAESGDVDPEGIVLGAEKGLSMSLSINAMLYLYVPHSSCFFRGRRVVAQVSTVGDGKRSISILNS